MTHTVIFYIYKGDYLIFPSTLETQPGLFRAGENIWSVGKQQRGACRGWLLGPAVCVRGWAGGTWGEEGDQSRAVLFKHEVTDLHWAWMG